MVGKMTTEYYKDCVYTVSRLKNLKAMTGSHTELGLSMCAYVNITTSMKNVKAGTYVLEAGFSFFFFCSL
jgi:hypothetical protein